MTNTPKPDTTIDKVCMTLAGLVLLGVLMFGAIYVVSEWVDQNDDAYQKLFHISQERQASREPCLVRGVPCGLLGAQRPRNNRLEE